MSISTLNVHAVKVAHLARPARSAGRRWLTLQADDISVTLFLDVPDAQGERELLRSLSDDLHTALEEVQLEIINANHVEIEREFAEYRDRLAIADKNRRDAQLTPAGTKLARCRCETPHINPELCPAYSGERPDPPVTGKPW